MRLESLKLTLPCACHKQKLNKTMKLFKCFIITNIFEEEIMIISVFRFPVSALFTKVNHEKRKRKMQ